MVRLYEAGNRGERIAEKRYNIAAYQQLKLDSVFSALDLESDDAAKIDKRSVLVSADSARLCPVGVAIYNRTATRATSLPPREEWPSPACCGVKMSPR